MQFFTSGLIVLFVFVSFNVASLEPKLQRGNKALILSFDKNWLPYIYKDKHGELKGLDAELLTGILSDMGYELELFPVPENRLKEIIGQGEIDVAIAAFKNKQREQSNWFSIPYRKEKTVIAFLGSREKEFQGRDIYALIEGNYSLGLNNGAWYGQKFEKEIKVAHKYQCFHIEGISRRLKMLSAGRVDLIVGDYLALKAAAKQLGMDNIKFSKEAVFEDDTHFIFSKKRVDEHFMQEFNFQLSKALEANL